MEQYLKEIEAKAGILVDALPYIRDFNDKIVVISYSCCNLLEGSKERRVMKDIVLLKSLGMRPVLVHNTRMGADKFRENKRFAKLLELCGVKAVGICGIDLQTLHMMLDNNYIPVVTPNDIDNEETILHPENTSLEIAVQLNAEKLVYLSEIPGISNVHGIPGISETPGISLHSDTVSKPETAQETVENVLPLITLSEAQKRYSEYEAGGAGEDFLRKLRNGICAIQKGVSRVHLLDGRIPHSLLLEFFSIDGVGTVLVRDSGQLYAHETAGFARRGQK